MNKNLFLRICRNILLLFIFVFLITSFPSKKAAAQDISLPQDCSMIASAVTPDITHGSICSFFESRMNNLLEKHYIPGAVISVVQGQSQLLSKGYGLADIDTKKPFTSTSLVRIASVSKTFTFTGIMQLVEQGKIKLDADVNTYLKDFKIPDKYDKPITIKDLMSHTSGFEDSVIDIGSHKAEDVPELGKFLASHIPVRVYPPGEVIAYSNYGAALAGYIVSQLSGVPYPEYIQKNIFDPLEMTGSTAFEPVPDNLKNNLSHSYEFDGKQFKTVPFIFDNLAPDGSISATSDDMAHFMIAYLNGGSYKEKNILQLSTVNQMRTQSFSMNKNISGWAYGFKEQNMNGYSVLMHDGGWESYVSGLLLFPDKQLGIFISFNSDGGSEAFGELLPAFMETFLPESSAPALRQLTPKPDPKDYEYGKKVAGFYRNTHAPITTVEKINSVIGPRVKANEDGSITFQGSRWVMIEPMVYQKIEGTDRIAFVDKASSHFLSTDRSNFIKVSLLENPIATIILLGFFLLCALISLLGCPVMKLINRLRHKSQRVYSKNVFWIRLLILAASIVGIALIFSVMVSIFVGVSLLYGIPLSVKMILLIPILFLGIILCEGYFVGKLWLHSSEKLTTKILYSLFLASQISFLIFLIEWNFLF